MQIMDAIYRRRAVRAYRDEPVKTELIGALIEAAVQAPSARNLQPWRFTVVRDKRLLDRVSRGAKAHRIETLPPDGGPHNLGERLTDPDFHIFYHAPTLIVISAAHEQPWAVEDCALAAGNLMLAACAHGLGTCWIGLAKDWLQMPEGKAALDIDSDWLPVAPIVVGYPQHTPQAVEREKPEIRWIGEGNGRSDFTDSPQPALGMLSQRTRPANKPQRIPWTCVHGVRRHAMASSHSWK